MIEQDLVHAIVDQEMPALGPHDHDDPSFRASSRPIWITPERDKSTGIPMRTTFMTISEVRRPVV